VLCPRCWRQRPPLLRRRDRRHDLWTMDVHSGAMGCALGDIPSGGTDGSRSAAQDCSSLSAVIKTSRTEPARRRDTRSRMILCGNTVWKAVCQPRKGPPLWLGLCSAMCAASFLRLVGCVSSWWSKCSSKWQQEEFVKKKSVLILGYRIRVVHSMFFPFGPRPYPSRNISFSRRIL
jgi:hypothetical protein